MTLNGFSREFLAWMFEYDNKSGVLVRRCTTAPNAIKGQRAGTVDGKGYLHVSISKRFVRVHRIIYFLETGDAPPVVDHVDGNKQNNLIANLRAADFTANAGNSRLSKRNVSGFKGVSLNKKSGKWHAQIKIAGKQTYLGRFDTADAAARRYDVAARLHFGEFAKVNYGAA